MATTSDQFHHAGLIGDAIRFRWRWLAVGLLVGGLLGGAFGLQRPPTYSATASVLVNPTVGNPYTSEDRRDELTSLESEAQTVRSDEVVLDAASDLGISPDAPILSKGLSITVPANTQIVQIQVSGQVAKEAQAAAAALAESYLEARASRSQEVVAGRASRLETDINDTAAAMQVAQRRATSGPAAERPVHERTADSLQTDLFNLQTQLTALEGLPTDPGRVISPPRLPASSAALAMIIFPIVGVLFGGLLGLVVAVSRERSRDVVRRSADISALDVPLLATLAGNGHHAPRGSAQPEALRRLRVEVLSAVDPPATIAVAACTSGTDSAGVGLELARALTAVDHRSVLVDAAGSDPSQRPAFDVGDSEGLSDAVVGGKDPSDLLLDVGGAAAGSLRFLPRGLDAAAAADHFLSERMRDLLAKIQAETDFLVLEAPSLLDADGDAIAAQADAVIAVVHQHTTTRGEVSAIAQNLRNKGVRILGAVVVARSYLRTGPIPLPNETSASKAAVAAQHREPPEPPVDADATTSAAGQVPAAQESPGEVPEVPSGNPAPGAASNEDQLPKPADERAQVKFIERRRDRGGLIGSRHRHRNL